MNHQNNLPYTECSRVISNISLVLSKSGETQFIPFVNLYSSSESQFDKEELLQSIEDFDFALGNPTGKHILSILQLNKLYLNLKNISNLVRQEIQRKLRCLINTIDADPPETQKLVRQLLLMKTDIDEDCKELFISFNQQLKVFNDCISAEGEISKELFQAPLKYLENYAIGKIYQSLESYLETIILSLVGGNLDKKNRHVIDNVFYLKESIFLDNREDVYNKFLSLICEVNTIIERRKNEFNLNNGNNDEIENKIYMRRFLAQLVKMGENVTEVKKFESKLREFSLEHKIKLSAVLDEEIHGLACTVSAVLKENIVTARLELRMNDDAYPLSVVYREFIKNLL